MSQGMSGSQNTSMSSDRVTSLGILPWIGAASQHASMNTAPQTNVTTSTVQSQSQPQSQQTQFSPQIIKSQSQQSSQPTIQNTSLDYPQVKKIYILDKQNIIFKMCFCIYFIIQLFLFIYVLHL